MVLEVKDMKKDMMVVSINAVTDNIMEIELVPVVNINKQNDMMDVAMNGNVSQILKEIEDKKQKRDKIYLPREWLSDNNGVRPHREDYGQHGREAACP